MTSVEPARRMSLAETAGLTGAVASSGDMADNIARRVYEAETPEEAFFQVEESVQSGLPSLEDMLYEPLIFIDVEYAPSKFEGTEVFGVYQVARAKPAPGSKNKRLCEWVQDGDAFLVSCGALNIIGGIANAKRRGWLPMALCITTAQTGAGFTAYWPRLIDTTHAVPDKPAAVARRASTPANTSDEAPF